MRLLIIIFLFCCLLTGCTRDGGYKRSQLDIESDRVIAEIGRKLSPKYKLRFDGMGGGAPFGKVTILEICFSRKGKGLNVEESRELIVNIVQDSLAAINKDEKLRPYLNDYPFTANNLGVMLINSDERGRDIYDPYIGSMYAKEGKIAYHSYDPENEFKFKFELRETFAEALSKLQDKN